MRRPLVLLCALCVITEPGHPEQPSRCDDGKTQLRRDLPGGEELACEERGSRFRERLPDIDTDSPVDASGHVCMDTPISYNDSLPTRGFFRPVEAESGEYLYCPPQRWLHNLRAGGVVLLYQPCVWPGARRGLEGLARSCLPHHVLTPHPQLSHRRPLAAVTWGRSLMMSHVTPGLCDWLVSVSYNVSQVARRGAKYNLFLTRPASAEPPKVEHLKSLKRCCLEAIGRGEEASSIQRSRKTRASVQRNRTSTSEPRPHSHTHPTNTVTTAQEQTQNASEFVQTSDTEGPRDRKSSTGWQRIGAGHSDEGVWAAAALGFLLVLLALSVLHTRLYRHCRPSTSLYWDQHHHQQDQDTVADIIRRRLRMVGRRKRRSSKSRKPECSLLSSSTENSE